jgi:hypothetical protein
MHIKWISVSIHNDNFPGMLLNFIRPVQNQVIVSRNWECKQTLRIPRYYHSIAGRDWVKRHAALVGIPNFSTKIRKRGFQIMLISRPWCYNTFWYGKQKHWLGSLFGLSRETMFDILNLHEKLVVTRITFVIKFRDVTDIDSWKFAWKRPWSFPANKNCSLCFWVTRNEPLIRTSQGNSDRQYTMWNQMLLLCPLILSGV